MDGGGKQLKPALWGAQWAPDLLAAVCRTGMPKYTMRWSNSSDGRSGGGGRRLSPRVMRACTNRRPLRLKDERAHRAAPHRPASAPLPGTAGRIRDPAASAMQCDAWRARRSRRAQQGGVYWLDCCCPVYDAAGSATGAVGTAPRRFLSAVILLRAQGQHNLWLAECAVLHKRYMRLKHHLSSILNGERQKSKAS